MSKFHPTGSGTYSLGAPIGSTDSTIILTSFTEPVTGTQYTMSNMNTDIAYGTIAPGTSSSEFISFTGITANIDGTSTLTGVVRGLAKKSPFTSDAAYKLPHSSQTTFILSNPPQLYEKYVSLENTETISGAKTFSGQVTLSSTTIPIYDGDPTFTTNRQIPDKKYVDDTVAAGVADASTTVKGKTKLSAAPTSPTDPIAVGTNDNRLSPVSLATVTADIVAALAGTGTPNGTTGKYVTNDDTSATASAGKVVRFDGSAKIPAPALTGDLPAISGASLTGIPVIKNGVVTYDMTTASGTQTIAHGLGKIPKYVRLTGILAFGANNVSSESFGSYNGTTNAVVWNNVGGTAGNVSGNTTNAIYLEYTGNFRQTGVVTVDATNITITWTKAGSPTGTAQILWEAQ